MTVTATNKFMDKRRLQEEAEKYGCQVEHHHPRRRIFTLRKGNRWTFLTDPVTGQPIQRMRSVSISGWKEAIRKGAEYLSSEHYREDI